MSQLAKILGKFAPGHELTLAPTPGIASNGAGPQDMTFVFNVIAHDQIGGIQKAWRAHLIAQLREMKDEGLFAEGAEGDAEFAAAVKELRDKYMAGEFDLIGEGGKKIAACYDGRLLLLRHMSIIKDDRNGRHPTSEEAAALMKARTVEVTELITVIFMESFPELKQKALAQEKEEAEAAQKHSAAP